MRMRALILTQHFTPEVTAGRFRIQPFVEALVSRGHQVDVLCPVPNHPRGIVTEGYRGQLRVRRRVHGADVTYAWVLARPEKTFWTRIGYYVSFAAIASALGVARIRRPDVIVASSPPLPVGAAGAILAARHRAPWILDVRDVWPDSAVALGELTNERLIGFAERLERWLYERSTAIVTVNDAFRRQIAARAGRQARIEVIPNGTTREWLDVGARDPDRAGLGLPRDRFVVAYAGNIGLAQGIEDAVEAAELLGEGFTLLVIGDGPRRGEVQRRATSLPPDRVQTRGLMPPQEAARYLRAADALLISERQDRTVASKLYDYCATGRPVIAACRGELRRVIEKAEVGLAVPYGDREALAAGIRTLRDDPALGDRLTRRGREFARSHLREAQARRLADLVEETVAARLSGR